MSLSVQIQIKNEIPYRYGLSEIPIDITKLELLYYFSFDEKDLCFITRNSRFPAYRIALAIQIGAYRFIGRAQQKPEEAPPSVIKFIAQKFKITGDVFPLEYSNRIMTRWNHDQLIRNYLGICFFLPEDHNILFKHLKEMSPDPGFFPEWIKKAEDFLRKKKYILPSYKSLKRLLSFAKQQRMIEIVNIINSKLDSNKVCVLEEMLHSKGDVQTQWFNLTNKQIFSSTPAKLTATLNRIKFIRNLFLINIDLTAIPDQYIKFLSQRGMHLSAKQLKRNLPPNRYAIMVATLRELESELIDISIQMNDEILSNVFLRGKGRSIKYLRKHKVTIRKVVSAFKFITDTLLDGTTNLPDKFENIESKYSPDYLRDLRRESDRLDIPRGTEEIYFASEGYQTIQKYFKELLETFTITSPSKNDFTLEAAKYYLKRKKENKSGIGIEAPSKFINEKRWKQITFDKNGKPKTKPWILCLADSLRKSFRKGSLKIDGARQYSSLDSDLISWTEWKNTDFNEYSNIPLASNADEIILPIFKDIQKLSGEYKRWINEETARIDNNNHIHFKKLDKVDEPESAIKLRPLLYKEITPRSIPEILFETDRLTGFTSFLTRLSSGQPIHKDEKGNGEALYAVLTALACNIPLAKMEISSGISIETLESIKEEVIRPQTLKAAMIELVNFYSRLPLAQIWGSGCTSNSDGQGIAAEGRPFGARYNQKRFKKREMGYIVYTHLADNYAPFYVQLIPASAREAIYVPDGLLYHGTTLIPREHYVDSHGFTDIVFAVLHLLGFRLAPRIANVPDLTLWYGNTYNVEYSERFTGKIKFQSIESQWELIQRFMLTIYTGKTRASQLIRKLSAFSRKHPLFKAFRNIGRILRTKHILELAGDKEFRRRIYQELNKGESKNSLAGDLRYGRKGTLRYRDPEMQLCAISATNLAILCISICNSIDMQNGIRKLRNKGHIINLEDLRFFSPYFHHKHNLYGNFFFHSIPDTHQDSIENAFIPLEE